MAVRISISVLVFLFNELFAAILVGGINHVVRWTAVVSALLNVPYYLAARAGRLPRTQAYVRMLLDVAFITVGLWSAGGLAAAPFVAIYSVVPVYVGLVWSSTACLVVTLVATAMYLVMAGLSPPPPGGPAAPGGWPVAIFNLLILNVVGALTAMLAEAYRQSRLRLAQANQELERANDAAQRLNVEIQRAAHLRVLGEVVAGVTHEIGNVLNIALGHVGLARRQASGQPALLTHLQSIEASCDTAMRVVRNALGTARQSSATQQPLSLASVAERIVELKRYDLRRDGIAVNLKFPDAMPPVLGAPYQLQQVFLNLVVNAQDALRARPEPRTIEIVGWCENGNAVVEVRDTGPGIPPDVLPRLFEPFFTTKSTGTGLGLAVSAGIVRELGGELRAENRPAGGAVFRLALPFVP
jgi:signal transduction histidine kinase